MVSNSLGTEDVTCEPRKLLTQVRALIAASTLRRLMKSLATGHDTCKLY